MLKKHLFAFAAGSLALTAAACAATASPLNPSAISAAANAHGMIETVRFGGGGSHGGGFGGMHAGGGFGGFHGGHFAGRPHFAGRTVPGRYAGRHDHLHHRHRFLFAGYPYFYYDDGYYDDDYGGQCWWSGRYHHWVCPDY